MLSFDKIEEVFFETADYLSSEESVVANEDLALGYEIWMSEPQSVKERRESFIRGMGLFEYSPSCDMERMKDCSGAVSSYCELSCNNIEKCRDFDQRNMNGEGNCMVDVLNQDHLDLDVAIDGRNDKVSPSVEQCEHRQPDGKLGASNDVGMSKKKVKSLWKILEGKIKKNLDKDISRVLKPVGETPRASRLKVQQNKKKCMEFSAVYIGQEFHAHRGLIWTMKFSPDGQYLASGGEDGVVRIWRISTTYTSGKDLYGDCIGLEKAGQGLKKSTHASVIIPDTDFQMEELPLHEFLGHTNDILDLAWSSSNCILSSSKDKTVRLWQVGHDECLGVFRHNNYVTCTQFNPVDENYFISDSIDGKVRIWGVIERRVVDWTDARDVITAICYHPNGKRFAIGSICGTFRFYEASDNELVLNAEIHIRGKKKCSGNRITGIQFSQDDSQKVMITSEDSKIRIFHGINVVHKYKGLSKSGSQMSASFTSTGRRIISVGEDSHIYVWNYDDLYVPSKKTKSVRSCEHFFYDGLSVAIPWSGTATDQTGSFSSSSPRCLSPINDFQATNSSCIGDSERFSLANWLFMDGSFRGNATWPEETLPSWGVPIVEQDNLHCSNHEQNNNKIVQRPGNFLASWGLVIVTASSDGMIRTFHNYGLPVRSWEFENFS